MSSATGMPNRTPNGISNGIYAGEASSGAADEPSAALEEENV